ncbi:hypothetical protein VB672_01155 [Microvirga sp. CF3016]|nr:hypothetical protein [Microvirga sp. CF3016]MEE1609856.1 hypothetical protein [Microvirga sp. CF3016]
MDQNQRGHVCRAVGPCGYHVMCHDRSCHKGSQGMQEEASPRVEALQDKCHHMAAEQDLQTSARFKGALRPAWKRHGQKANQKDRDEADEQFPGMDGFVACGGHHRLDG